jgi:hypothetical protein
MITELLSGKVVSQVFRNREAEVSIEFTDGTKLFIDKTNTGVELSIISGTSD